MARRLGRWLAVAAICATVLFIPTFSGANQIFEDWSRDSHYFLISGDGGGRLGLGPAPLEHSRDKDCIGDFSTRAQAQRFFERHEANRDPHHLDSDRDGKACEQFEYQRPAP